MKRLLQEYSLRAGLMVMALLFAPSLALATDYVSTITGVIADGSVYNLDTSEEGNTWFFYPDVAPTYNEDAGYADINVRGTVILYSSFYVSGRITSVTIEGACNGGSFSLSVPDYGDIISTTVVDASEQLTTYTLTPNADHGNDSWDEQSLMLTYMPADNAETSDFLHLHRITIHAVTDYGIVVYTMTNNVEVNSTNADDVLGDSTVSFNPDDNILTLNNAQLMMLEFSLANPTISLVGASTITSMESFITFWSEEELPTEPTLTFTTGEGADGTLTFVGTDGGEIGDEGMLFGEFTPVYSNSLFLEKQFNTYVIHAYTTYQIRVQGAWVTSRNKDDILEDGTKSVRFDPQTNTLMLNKVNLQAKTSFVTAGLDFLNVVLHGTNTIEADDYIFESSVSSMVPTLTFSSGGSKQDKLKWDATALLSGFSVAYHDGLALDEPARLIAAAPVGYGLTVAGTEVTDVNSDDVLGDGKVSFDATTAALTLDGVSLTGDIALSSESSLRTLTVMLKGENTTTGIFSSGRTASLAFTINPNNPGSLTFTGKTSASDIQSGFTFTTERTDDTDTYLLNGLEQGAVNDGADWLVSTFIPIAPIMNEEESEVTIPLYAQDFTEDDGQGGTTNKSLANTAINDVLYTLPDNADGFSTDDGTPGVVIASAVTDAEVEEAIDKKVGSAEYAQAFHGITLMAPAGIGMLSFNAKSFGGTLRVKIGDSEPYTPTEINNSDYNSVTIDYNNINLTYVYIYLLDDQQPSARSDAPYRGKVQTATVKVSSYSGKSSVMVSGGGATVYSGGAAYSNDSHSAVTMTSVSVGGTSSAVDKSRYRQAPSTAVSFPIVELGPDVFNDIDDKTGIRYIDLSGTQIKDLTVNRNAGVLKDFGKQTLICLPEDNDDGEEVNVVVGSQCKQLTLCDAYTFQAPRMEFTAAKASLMRNFTVGKTSTVFLPFNIPAAQAEGLGKFFSFTEVRDTNVLFSEENGNIAANTPYLFEPGTKTIEATEVAVQGIDDVKAASGSFHGTYEELWWMEDTGNIYGFAASAEGTIEEGTFVRVGFGAWLPPFRAYLEIGDAADTSAPSRLKVVVGNVTTAISTVDTDERHGRHWFTVGGQQLSGKPGVKGLYIYNGKKTVVK